MQKEAASLRREARSTALASATKRKHLQEEEEEEEEEKEEEEKEEEEEEEKEERESAHVTKKQRPNFYLRWWWSSGRVRQTNQISYVLDLEKHWNMHKDRGGRMSLIKKLALKYSPTIQLTEFIPDGPRKYCNAQSTLSCGSSLKTYY
jgi:hypothetical protein